MPRKRQISSTPEEVSEDDDLSDVPSQVNSDIEIEEEEAVASDEEGEEDEDASEEDEDGDFEQQSCCRQQPDRGCECGLGKHRIRQGKYSGSNRNGNVGPGKRPA